jgi:hypothetical protein
MQLGNFLSIYPEKQLTNKKPKVKIYSKTTKSDKNDKKRFHHFRHCLDLSPLKRNGQTMVGKGGDSGLPGGHLRSLASPPEGFDLLP